LFDQIPHEVKAAAPGFAGSIIALFFLRRPPVLLAGMFLGGCAMAYLGTHWFATHTDMHTNEGLVGFLIGMFSMAIVAKVYDTIDAISPSEIWEILRERIRVLLGAKGGERE
jgi:hypothetical protein